MVERYVEALQQETEADKFECRKRGKEKREKVIVGESERKKQRKDRLREREDKNCVCVMV